jgi:hypothetical protein
MAQAANHRHTLAATLGFGKQRPHVPGQHPRSAIISPFYETKQIDMEAERLNAIEGSLADLRRRAGELRGYL